MDGIVLLPHPGMLAVAGHPVSRERQLVVGLNAGTSDFDGNAIAGRKNLRGAGQFGGFHPELAGRESGSVDACGLVDNGGVAALADVGQDGGDRRLQLARRRRLPAEGGQLRVKVAGTVAERAHERETAKRSPALRQNVWRSFPTDVDENSGGPMEYSPCQLAKTDPTGDPAARLRQGSSAGGALAGDTLLNAH